jgi:capsular polysaccharide biosynthesis protein
MRESLTNAIIVSLLVAAVVVAYGLHQTPTYEATAVVLVGQKNAADTDLHSSISGLDTLTLLVAKAVPTMPVARAVVERVNPPGRSAEEVLSNMSVEREPRTAFVDVTYEASDAKMAQVIANAIGQVVEQKIGEVKLGNKVITATLWRPARLPNDPVSPKPWRNGLIALVASLGLAIPAVLVAHRYQRS